MNTQVVPRRAALRWGLLFGVINAVVMNSTIPLGFLFPTASALVENLVSVAVFGINLLLCGCAGYIAARKSGSPYVGNSAGLYAGLVSAIMGAPVSLLLIYIMSETARHFMFIFIFSYGCVIGLFALLGLIAGVIGGQIAQRRSRKGATEP